LKHPALVIELFWGRDQSAKLGCSFYADGLT